MADSLPLKVVIKDMGKRKRRTVKRKSLFEYVDGARYTADFSAVNLVIAKSLYRNN